MTDGFIVTGFNNAQSGTSARSVSLTSSPISQTVTVTDPAAAATVLVALAPQLRSDTRASVDIGSIWVTSLTAANCSLQIAAVWCGMF